jgi:transcriptional regulator, XRE family
MEENIYILPDGEIRRRVGRKVRQLRLRQNFTQASLAEQAQVSLTTLKKIEKGDISYFDSLMRVLRVLGELDVFSPLIKEEKMSPNEYFEFVEANKKKQRKRSSGGNKTKPQSNAPQPNTEESEW